MADKKYTKLPVVNQTTTIKNFFDTTVEQQEHDIKKDGRFKDEIKVSEWTQEYMNRFIDEFEKNKRKKVKKRNNNF